MRRISLLAAPRVDRSPPRVEPERARQDSRNNPAGTLHHPLVNDVEHPPEFTWAAELADYVLANDGAHAAAKRIKAQALIELGERQINAIARNYYLSSARYLLKDLPPQ